MITVPYTIEKEINLNQSVQEKIALKFRNLELSKMNLQELLKVKRSHNFFFFFFFFLIASSAKINTVNIHQKPMFSFL